MILRPGLWSGAVLLLCACLTLRAQDQDAAVLSAAIAHYSNTRSNPLLVIAGETIEASRIVNIETGSPDVSSAVLDQLRERNAKPRPVGDVRFPANAVLIRGALALIRRLTPTGEEVSDWSPFTHAYPGSQLLQFAAPVYFTPGERALVYFWSGSGPESTQGSVYILEKRGFEWHVISSESP